LYIPLTFILLISLFMGCCTGTGEEPVAAGRVEKGRAYYAGRAAEAQGKTEEAARFYRLQLEGDGTGMASLEAADGLLGILLDRGSFRRAYRLSRECVDRFGRDEKILLRYAEVCLALGKNRKALWSAHEAWDLHPGPEELLLLTEASRRAGLPVWTDRMMDLFLDYPASLVHVRAREHLGSAFPETLQDRALSLIRGKALAAEGRRDEALHHLQIYFRGDLPVSTLLVREIGSLFDAAERQEEGITFFSNRLNSPEETYPDEVRAVMHEQIGDFLLSSGHPAEAVNYLTAVGQSGKELTDAAAGTVLRALEYSSDLPTLVEAAVEILPTLSNPRTVSGFLDELVSSLVREALWDEIARLGPVLEETGPRIVAARCAFITGRLLEEGYIQRETGESPEDLFRTAVRMDPLGYYGFVAAAGLSSEEGGFSIDGSEDTEKTPGPEAEFILGFFEEGLIHEGLNEVYERIDRLGVGGATAIAKAAAERGYYLDSLRIMLRWNAARNTPPETDALYLLYPRWFRREITGAAGDHGIPLHIFFALVREESAFQPDIISHAGAVGLSQLMPETAAYTAGLMGLPSFTIEDPGDNTLIGSRYLAKLRSDLPTYAHSLAAYNAGPGRTAGWIRWFGTLPPDLFVEAIPITETRRYVKRVLVSSVYYGYLYDTVPPLETVLNYYR